MHCIAGVNKPRIVWVYHASSASPMYDKQIIFDWSNARWARRRSPLGYGDCWHRPISISIPPARNDQVTRRLTAAPSLDSFAYIGGRPLIGAIDPDGFLSALHRPQSAGHAWKPPRCIWRPGMRAFVSDAYPLDDARDDATGTVAAGTRERLQDAWVWGTPVTIEITGSAALYSSSTAASLPPVHSGGHGLDARAGRADRGAAGRTVA